MNTFFGGTVLRPLPSMLNPFTLRSSSRRICATVIFFACGNALTPSSKLNLALVSSMASSEIAIAIAPRLGSRPNRYLLTARPLLHLVRGSETEDRLPAHP